VKLISKIVEMLKRHGAEAACVPGRQRFGLRWQSTAATPLLRLLDIFPGQFFLAPKRRGASLPAAVQDAGRSPLRFNASTLQRLTSIGLTVAALAPAKLFACAACGSANANIEESSLTDGMNLAILTLGVFILTVLGGFLTFLIYVMRKSEAVEAARRNSLQPAKL